MQCQQKSVSQVREKASHWVKMCRSTETEQIFRHQKCKPERKEGANLSTGDKELHLSDVKAERPEATAKLNVRCSSSGSRTTAMAIPDTGAEGTICGPNSNKTMRLSTNQLNRRVNGYLVAANGTSIKTGGKMTFQHWKLRVWASTKTLSFVKDNLTCYYRGKNFETLGSFQYAFHDQYG